MYVIFPSASFFWVGWLGFAQNNNLCADRAKGMLLERRDEGERCKLILLLPFFAVCVVRFLEVFSAQEILKKTAQ